MNILKGGVQKWCLFQDNSKNVQYFLLKILRIVTMSSEF